MHYGETGPTKNQVEMLWYDKSVSWELNTSYRWMLTHHPDSGLIKIDWYNVSGVLF